MTNSYPAILSIIIVSTAAVGAGAGLVVSGEFPSANSPDNELCTYAETTEQSILLDETVQVSSGSKNQLVFIVPDQKVAVQVKINSLMISTADITLTDSNNNVLIQSSADDISQRDVGILESGNYELRITNNDTSAVETDIEVRAGLC